MEDLKTLFQKEFSKMVAVISKLFGLQYLGAYEQQNESLLNQELINQGTHYLYLSAQGEELKLVSLRSPDCVLALRKEDTKEKWQEILKLYDQLLLANPSPSVALNRTYAMYKVMGPQPVLVEAEKLQFENNHFYFVLLGELYKNIDVQKARVNFQKVISLAKTETEKEGIQEKIDELSL